MSDESRAAAEAAVKELQAHIQAERAAKDFMAQQLTESRASEAKLREALRIALNARRVTHGHILRDGVIRELEAALSALAQPQSD